MSDAPTPLEIYYASEYHRRNMQVARVCGAQASVDQALERALTVKSIPVWLIAYLESAANRLPGLQTDLAAWRDIAPDAPETVRAEAAEAKLARAERVDALPEGHVILEQSDMLDGRVNQTVRDRQGNEYSRLVHPDEAYGETE